MKKDPLYKSFGYAFQGISNTIRTERNIKIHCTVALLVTIFGIWLQISKTEWMICFILFGLILALELMNTAVEATVEIFKKMVMTWMKLVQNMLITLSNRLWMMDSFMQIRIPEM